jgi:hypothetical protein
MGMGMVVGVVVPMIVIVVMGIRLPFKPGLAFAAAAYGTHHSTSSIRDTHLLAAGNPRRPTTAGYTHTATSCASV